MASGAWLPTLTAAAAAVLCGCCVPSDGTMPLTTADAQHKFEQLQARRSSGAAIAGPPPWRRLLSSAAVWAIVVNNFAFHYAFYLVMNWLPTYFNRCGQLLAANSGLDSS